MQELGKFNFKIIITLNGLEKHMNFNINNKLVFIDSFQFFKFLLGSLAKNLVKDDFKHLSQKFDNNTLDLIKQKRFYPYGYMNVFKNLKKNCQAKKRFIVL